jgi:hypothetical protein
MVCPECGEEAVAVAPTSLTPQLAPVADWSHRDGEPLCPVMTVEGYRAALPVPADATDTTTLDWVSGQAVGRELGFFQEWSRDEDWDEDWEAGF